MLTIVFLLSALHLLSSATPVEQDAGVKIAIHKRSLLTSDDGLANIEALIAQILFARSKYQNTFRAYQRNTGEQHPLAIDFPFLNVTKRDTGPEPLTEEQGGALWQGAISVGTPAQSFTVDFDTGSSDLFLPGSKCTTNCKGHNPYDTSKSTTAVDRGKKFSLQYGDGSSVSGEQYSDTVTVARLTGTRQALGAATTYSTGFSSSNFPPDGLLGMAYQSISQYNAPPFFQTLVSQGKTTQPIFAFKLAAAGSEVFLGGVNAALYTGSFTTVPVTTQAYWQVKLDSVTANSKASVGSIPAIIDTGTTLIIGDNANVKKFYASIPGSKDASKTAFSIPPSSFNLGRASVGSKDCVGSIVGDDMSFWIVGDRFLENVYTSFDLGKNQVGFAALK
ncbi:unnamed protein product [Somion occarium]|uniref:Peptidase A1 domain-containing protein n=1 Tax=Somion occarium TaxID=3059160 RepID=A0ABP1D5K7_9APHY